MQRLELVHSKIVPGLTTVEIGEGVKVCCLAFYKCSGLTQLIIRESVIIDESAFKGCPRLRELVTPQRVDIEASAFSTRAIADKDLFDCMSVSLVPVMLPDLDDQQMDEHASAIDSTLLDNRGNVNVGDPELTGSTGLRARAVHKIATIHQFAFNGCNAWEWMVIPDNYPKYIFPALTTVTHTDFYSFFDAPAGLQGVEQMHDKIAIYRLCHSRHNITQAVFKKIIPPTGIYYVRCYSSIL